MDDIKPTNVLLPVRDDTHTTHVTSTSDHDKITSIELDEIDDLVLLEVEFDGIVDVDGWVGVTDGSAVVCDDVWDALGTDSDTFDSEEFVFGFFRGDSVDGEAAFNIVENAEVLARLFDADNIHIAGRVCIVSSDFVINFDKSLHDNLGDFIAGQGVF